MSVRPDHSPAVVKQTALQLQGRRCTVIRTHNNTAAKPDVWGVVRGEVSHFSRKSRRRLLDYINSLDKSTQGAKFITLTYGQQWPGAAESKRHLDTFLKRLRRRDPGSSAIWRAERQQRGAIHYHLIVFNARFWPKHELAQAWADVIGAEYCDNSTDVPRNPFTRIESLNSFKRVVSYVAKYVAKVDDKLGLTSVHNSPLGRHWGIFNRENLPLATLEQYTFTIESIEDQQRYADFLRAVRRKVGKRLLTNPKNGITLYSENISDWRRYLEVLGFNVRCN